VHPVQNPKNRREKGRSLWFADSQPMRENAALREEREQQQQQLSWNPNIQSEVQAGLLPMIQRQRETEWDIQGLRLRGWDQQQLQWNPNIQTEVQAGLSPMIQRQRETVRYSGFKA
jgi:hypothetical protein